MEIITDGVPEIEEFMQEVLPDVQVDGVPMPLFFSINGLDRKRKILPDNWQ